MMYLEPTLLAWFELVQPVNADLYFFAGVTGEAARLGVTWRCRAVFSVRVAEAVTFGGKSPINLAVAGEARWRDWRMRSS